MEKACRKYLNGRGITDEAIERYGIGGDANKVIIPVSGFNKYRTYPNKSYFYDKGFKAALFGLQQLAGSAWCVLTEGELDALRLASEGIPAASGTGGVGTFKSEWAVQLPSVVLICYDTDKAGKEGALKVHWMMPKSRVIELPEGFKDVTEYMASHTKEDFNQLIMRATRVPKPVDTPPVFRARSRPKDDTLEQVKKVPITDYVAFRHGKAKCIWHTDRNPSMHYYPKDNRVHCFGCGKSGDIVDVVMAVKGVNFKEALKIISTTR